MNDKKKLGRQSAVLSRSFISSPDQVPSLPQVALSLIHSVLDDSTSADEIARGILLDPILTSRVLKAANSSLFGLRKPVSTVSRAIPILGRKILKNFILTSVIFETFKIGNTEGFKAFWKHTVGCALVCEWFCSNDETLPDPEEGFLGGLLHDIGKLIIFSHHSHMMEKVLERLSDQSYLDQRTKPPLMVENDIWHVDHTIVGKWAAEKWKLPESIVECIWLHHQPITFDEHAKSLPRLIRFADALCNVHAIGDNYFLNSIYKLGCHLHYANTFNIIRELWKIEEDDIKNVLTHIYSKMGEYAELFDIETDSEETFIPTLCKANYALGQMHLKVEEERSRLLVLNTYIKALTNFISHCADDPYLRTLVEATWRFISPIAVLHELILYVAAGFPKKVYLYKLTKDGILEKTQYREEEPLDIDSMLDIISGQQDLKENLKEAFNSRKSILRKSKNKEEGDVYPFFWAIPLFLSEPGKEQVLAGGLVCKASVRLHSRIKDSNLSYYLNNFSSVLMPMLSIILTLETASDRDERLSLFTQKLGISEEQMIQQQRLAIIGQLATGAAHEINNPLAVISVKAQMLEKKLSEGDREKYINVILGQTERIAKITSDLMNFARPTKPQRESARLKDILDQVASVVRARIGPREIRFIDNIPKNLPLVYVDMKQIEQVFINLIINACHAVGTDGKIEISATSSKNYVIVSVKDNGIGIRREDLPKIFDPFFTTKTEGKGTGLGLPISQRIIEINGGKITVESEEGKGATFFVWLPIDQSLALGNIEKGSAGLPNDKGKRIQRVLVVEDEQHLREVLKENLTREDVCVEAVEDGLAAIETLKNNTYNLAIVDLVMPRMNGFELIDWLKKNVPGLPVVVISAFASEDEAKKLYKLGVKKFLKKPFKIEELRVIVDTLR